MEGRDRNSQGASQKREVLFCEINCICAKRLVSADVEKGLVCGGERSEMNRESGINIHALSCVKWTAVRSCCKTQGAQCGAL